MTTKKLVVLVMAPAIGLTTSACRDDVVLPPAPSLIGDYAGMYTYKTGLGEQADSLTQAVTFDFGENLWHMFIDTTSPNFDPNVCFCNAWGPYAVTDRVRLELHDDIPQPVRPCDACDQAQSPQGAYTLEQPPGGIRLAWIQAVTDGAGTRTITSRLYLTKVDK